MAHITQLEKKNLHLNKCLAWCCKWFKVGKPLNWRIHTYFSYKSCQKQPIYVQHGSMPLNMMEHKLFELNDLSIYIRMIQASQLCCHFYTRNDTPMKQGNTFTSCNLSPVELWAADVTNIQTKSVWYQGLSLFEDVRMLVRNNLYNFLVTEWDVLSRVVSLFEWM